MSNSLVTIMLPEFITKNEAEIEVAYESFEVLSVVPRMFTRGATVPMLICSVPTVNDKGGNRKVSRDPVGKVTIKHVSSHQVIPDNGVFLGSIETDGVETGPRLLNLFMII